QQSVLRNVTVAPLDLALTLTPEVTKESEPSPVQQEALAQTPGSAEESETPPVLEEAPSEAPEHPEELETPPVLEEAPSQALEHPEEVDSSLQQDTQAQLPEHPEEVEPSPVQLGSPAHAPGFQTQDGPQILLSDEAEFQRHLPLTFHSHLPSVTLQPPDLGLTITPESTKEAGSTTAQQQALPQPLEHRKALASYPDQQETSAQPPEPPGEAEPLSEQERPAESSEPPGEDEPFPTQQETPAQTLEPPKELVVQPPLYQPVTNAIAGQDPAGQDQAPNLTVQPFEVILTVTPEPIKVEHSSTPPPSAPEATVPRPEQVEAQHPAFTEVTLQPLDLELTISAEPTKGDAPSPTMPEALTQPPVGQTQTVLTPHHDKGEHPASPSVTVKPVDPEPTIAPEPTTEAERSTGLQQATAPPLDHPEVALPHPSLTQVTVQPVDVELTETTGSDVEAEPSPTEQETPTQPPEPSHQEVTVATASKDQGQEATLTLRPTTEAEPSTVLQETTSPAAEYPEVTHPYPGPTQATAPPVSITSPGSSETVLFPSTQSPVVPSAKYTPEKVQSEPTAVAEHIDICELCTCRNETLSCTGLSPNQRLRSVPILGSKSYNYTFTV
uniref:Leucine-rich repeat-containing protein 37 N-terminal domain-containing protein n=1 Tax=Catagonus wagneri TaxID=51154 RepID=A0A8C3X9N2_9CETA